MRRAGQVGDVVDIQRIDPDEGRSSGHEHLTGLGRQKRVSAEVAFGAPVPRKVCANEHGLAMKVACWQGVRADRPPRVRRVNYYDRQVGNACEV
jgi:hypothetical protein